MFMAVNIGNTRISVGFFDEDSSAVRYRFDLSTDLSKTVDEYFATVKAIVREYGYGIEGLKGGIVSSVVPQLTATVCEMVERFVGKEPVLVGPGVKTGFPIKIDSLSFLICPKIQATFYKNSAFNILHSYNTLSQLMMCLRRSKNL